MKLKLASLAAVVVLLGGLASHARRQKPAAPPRATNDPHGWLEDVAGDKAMAWVGARNVGVC